MIIFYALTGISALIITLFVRSHRIMNAISTLHAFVTLMLTGYLLKLLAKPTYFLRGRLFFIDHLGLYETLITTSIFLLASIYAYGYVDHLIRAGEMNKRNLKLFYSAFNLLLITIIMAFFSNSLALLWIFTELTTLFSAILIVTLNAKENIMAALNYVFIASSSMLFSFIGLILLFATSRLALGAGTLNWDALMNSAQQLSPIILGLSCILIFIGFAAKSGIAPFHAWLPHAHSKAPSVISALLSAVLLNLGVYGILRIYAVAQQTTTAPVLSGILIIFGIITIAIAAFSMIAQKNLKKLIAFSSIENMGLVLLGIGLGTPIAFFWVLFHILGHSVSKALLFFSVGILHRQYDSVQAEEMKGMLALQPLATTGLIVGSFAVIGAPLMPIFLSKLFILLQVSAMSPWLLIAVALLLFIVATAFAVILIPTVSQTSTTRQERFSVPRSMCFPIIILIVTLFILGVLFPVDLTGLLTTIITELGIIA